MTSENDQPERVDPGDIDQTCQLVEATTADGHPVTFAVHAVTQLTPEERAALGEIARAAVEHSQRVNPHGGVITELMQASLRVRMVFRARNEVQLANRLSVAIRAAADVIRAQQAELAAERESRFRWAEEAAHLTNPEPVSVDELAVHVWGVRDARDVAQDLLDRYVITRKTIPYDQNGGAL